MFRQLLSNKNKIATILHAQCYTVHSGGPRIGHKQGLALLPQQLYWHENYSGDDCKQFGMLGWGRECVCNAWSRR
jgi:hypothetical protein